MSLLVLSHRLDQGSGFEEVVAGVLDVGDDLEDFLKVVAEIPVQVEVLRVKGILVGGAVVLAQPEIRGSWKRIWKLEKKKKTDGSSNTAQLCHGRIRQQLRFLTGLELSAVRDLDLLERSVAFGGLHDLDLVDDAHAPEDFAEDHVLAVQMRAVDGRDEELGSVGPGPGVGHGQQSRRLVLQKKVLVLKFLAVDGLAAGPVPVREVAAYREK